MSINVEDSSAESAIVLDVTTKYGQKSNQLSSRATNTEQSPRKKWHQKLFKVDVIVVTITIAIVIGLFQLPIIYFYIPVVSEWYIKVVIGYRGWWIMLILSLCYAICQQCSSFQQSC